MLINSTLNYMTDTPTIEEVELECYKAQLILEIWMENKKKIKNDFI